MKLYGFSRSSAAFRVRIALNFKGIKWEDIKISLPDGEQFGDPYLKINSQARVPTLVDKGVNFYQSMAIIEYLEETCQEPRLLPTDPIARARVRGISNIIACDIHPLNNLAVLKFLSKEMQQDKQQVNVQWYHHWIKEGLKSVEEHLANDKDTGRFAHGEQPTLADVCIVPQIFNAQRYDCDLSPYPVLMGVFERAMLLPSFEQAQP